MFVYACMYVVSCRFVIIIHPKMMYKYFLSYRLCFRCCSVPFFFFFCSQEIHTALVDFFLKFFFDGFLYCCKRRARHELLAAYGHKKHAIILMCDWCVLGGSLLASLRVHVRMRLCSFFFILFSPIRHEKRFSRCPWRKTEWTPVSTSRRSPQSSRASPGATSRRYVSHLVPGIHFPRIGQVGATVECCSLVSSAMPTCVFRCTAILADRTATQP